MFSKRMREIRNTVRFRLTLYYGLAFALCSLAALLLAYFGLKSSLIADLDDVLREEIDECTALYAQGGVRAVKGEIRLESGLSEAKNVGFRVIEGGREAAVSEGPEWRTALDAMRRAAVPDVSRLVRPRFETLTPPGDEPYRVAQARIGPGAVVQVLHGLRQSELVLGRVLRLFLIVLVLLLIVSVFGTWMAARRAMAGVEAVTQAALEIEAGDLKRRVTAAGSGREIENLAAAFNRMLDKVAAVMAALEEINDNIAHELRSPIARIRGAAEMAAIHEAHDETQRETAGSIVEECDKLLALVNAMLDISELRAGLSGLKRGPVDIPRLVLDTCEFFEPAAEDAGVALRVEPLPDLVVEGDAQRLQRAFANIIDNAVKYTPPGGRVTVSGRLSPRVGSISIRDTGIGIASAELPRLFQRFYRTDLSRSKGGSGLGLALAQAILELHGGRIAVKSTPGTGSTFTVELPLPAQ